MQDPASPHERPFYHYILVRKDLPLHIQAINIAHAAGESIQTPIPSTTRVALFHVHDLNQLQEYESVLIKKQIPHATVYEPDHPYYNAKMALGVTPTQQHSKMRKIFHHLNLWNYPT